MPKLEWLRKGIGRIEEFDVWTHHRFASLNSPLLDFAKGTVFISSSLIEHFNLFQSFLIIFRKVEQKKLTTKTRIVIMLPGANKIMINLVALEAPGYVNSHVYVSVQTMTAFMVCKFFEV